ncbi:hypothetical protein [Psychroserpens algicola]|uniref:hypothetical protein n=1 Tax=Psychroserpens algicola TaxID=1719034 RepID=UPI0019541C4B|nr:hypothetical protein [Psychroserpens algicola]
MKHIYRIIISVLLLQSCATLYNSETTKVKIFVPENTSLVFDNDTLSLEKNYLTVFPKRSKDDLKFSLFNSETESDFSFKSRKSTYYYLNILTNYGIGMLIDANSNKRFTYKNVIHFELDTTTQNFVVSNSKISPFRQHDVFMYTSPLRAIDITSDPMLTLGVEYFILDDFSVSLEYGTIFTQRFRVNPTNELVENKGHSQRLEIKYYNGFNLTQNPRINEYLGLEARFISHQFTDDIQYLITDEDISYTRTEDFIVQKAVSVFNLKYGFNFPVGKRLYFDVYSGFGLRLKDIKNPNIFFDRNLHSYLDIGHHDYFGKSNLEAYQKNSNFNVSLGFKFGIKL